MAKNKTMTAACWFAMAALPALVACGAPPDGHEGEGQGEPTATTETAAANGAEGAKQELAAPKELETLHTENCLPNCAAGASKGDPTIVPGDPGTIILAPITFPIGPIFAPPVQAPVYAH